MVVRLEFTSTFEMLDLVQIVCDHVARSAGLDEDGQNDISVAIRESVINAIKHGNRGDPGKLVFVDFSIDPAAGDNGARALTIRVRDQGEGFDPAAVADPLAPENLLKPSGRGIFLIRNFMDDLQWGSAPQGGMDIQMVKRVL